MKILENELLTIEGKENLSKVQLYGVLPLRPSYDIDRCIKQIEINLSEYIKPEVESKINYLKWCRFYYFEKLSLYTSPLAAPMVEHEHVYLKELIEWTEAKIKVLSEAKPAKKSDKLSTPKSKRLIDIWKGDEKEMINILNSLVEDNYLVKRPEGRYELADINFRKFAVFACVLYKRNWIPHWKNYAKLFYNEFGVKYTTSRAKPFQIKETEKYLDAFIESFNLIPANEENPTKKTIF